MNDHTDDSKVAASIRISVSSNLVWFQGHLGKMCEYMLVAIIFWVSLS